MVLTDADIAKFQALYRSEFGKEISAEHAYEQGIKLVRLMSAVYRPMTKEQFEKIQKHREATLPLLIKKITQDELESRPQFVEGSQENESNKLVA
jgi:hypothetical protein